MQDHSRQYPVQYLENNVPAIQQSAWLIIFVASELAYLCNNIVNYISCKLKSQCLTKKGFVCNPPPPSLKCSSINKISKNIDNNCEPSKIWIDQFSDTAK